MATTLGSSVVDVEKEILGSVRPSSSLKRFGPEELATNGR
jgi:hypothetical protein